MTDIEKTIRKLVQFSPGFDKVWKEWLVEDELYGDGDEITLYSVFSSYVLFVSENLDVDGAIDKPALFSYIESSVKSGDYDLVNSVITCFLETLVQFSGKYFKPENYFPYLHEESIISSKEWDEFNGHRTKGLW